MHGLKKLLNFEGNVEDCYDRTFQGEIEIFGTHISVDLKPNGSEMKLNNSNREGK